MSSPSGNASLKTTIVKLSNGKMETKVGKLTPGQIKRMRTPLGTISNTSSSGNSSAPRRTISNTSSGRTTSGSKPIFDQQETNSQQHFIKCNVMEKLTKNLMKKQIEVDVPLEHSSFFLYETQEDANESRLSIMLEDESTYLLPKKPKNGSLIEFLTNGKYTGAGTSLGSYSIINNENVVNLGLKLKNINDLHGIILGNKQAELVPVNVSIQEFITGQSTKVHVMEDAKKLLRQAYGKELTYSSPTGQVKSNSQEKPPILNLFVFPLEPAKIDLIVRLIETKYQDMMSSRGDGQPVLSVGGKEVNVRTLVTQGIREISRLARDKITKPLKTKLSGRKFQIGFFPAKEMNLIKKETKRAKLSGEKSRSQVSKSENLSSSATGSEVWPTREFAQISPSNLNHEESFYPNDLSFAENPPIFKADKSCQIFRPEPEVETNKSAVDSLVLHDIAIEKGVLCLTAENFTEVISSLEFVLVHYYVPNWKRCKELKPEFSKAAMEMAQHNIYFTQVDATTADKLVEEYSVEVVPTISLFRRGVKVRNYSGRNVSSEIIQFVAKHANGSQPPMDSKRHWVGASVCSSRNSFSSNTSDSTMDSDYGHNREYPPQSLDVSRMQHNIGEGVPRQLKSKSINDSLSSRPKLHWTQQIQSDKFFQVPEANHMYTVVGDNEFFDAASSNNSLNTLSSNDTWSNTSQGTCPGPANSNNSLNTMSSDSTWPNTSQGTYPGPANSNNSLNTLSSDSTWPNTSQGTYPGPANSNNSREGLGSDISSAACFNSSPYESLITQTRKDCEVKEEFLNDQMYSPYRISNVCPEAKQDIFARVNEANLEERLKRDHSQENFNSSKIYKKDDLSSTAHSMFKDVKAKESIIPDYTSSNNMENETGDSCNYILVENNILGDICRDAELWKDNADPNLTQFATFAYPVLSTFEIVDESVQVAQETDLMTF